MDNDIYVDIHGLLQSVKNELQLGLLRSMCKDDQQRKDITAMIRSFTSRGIEVETAMDILTELVEYVKKMEE